MKPFIGTVLQRAFAGRTRAPSAEVLAALRPQFSLLGRGSQALVLKLHRLEGATPQDRLELFRLGSQVRLNALAFDEANAFATRVIAEHLTQSADPHRQISDLLAVDYPDGWSIAVPRAIGHWMGMHPGSVSEAWSVLFAQGAPISMGIVAVGEAMRSGGRSSIISHVVRREGADLPSVEAGAFCGVIVAVGADLTTDEKASLGEWLATIGGVPAATHVPALLALADASATARTAALALLRSLDPKERARLAAKALRGLPRSVVEILSAEILETLPDSVAPVDLAMTRIAAARAIASNSPSGQATLLMYAMDPSRKVSSTAVQAIVELPRATLLAMADRLPGLLESQYPYVRITILDLLRQLLAEELSSDVAFTVASRLKGLRDAASLQALLRFLGDGAFVLKREPPGALESIAQILVEAIMSGSRQNPGTLRIGLRSLIPIVWEWGDDVRRIVSEFASTVLSTTNLADIGDGERAMIDLLGALARHDHGLLGQLVANCGQWHARNIRSLACAVRRCDGARSHLVDTLLRSPSCPAEVTTAILEWRGV